MVRVSRLDCPVCVGSSWEAIARRSRGPGDSAGRVIVESRHTASSSPGAWATSSLCATDTRVGALNSEGGRRLRRSRIRRRSIGEMGIMALCKLCGIRRTQSLTGPARSCVKCARDMGLLAPAMSPGRKTGATSQPWHVRHSVDDSRAKRVEVLPHEPRVRAYRHVVYDVVWDGTHGRVLEP